MQVCLAANRNPGAPLEHGLYVVQMTIEAVNTRRACQGASSEEAFSRAVNRKKRGAYRQHLSNYAAEGIETSVP